MSKLIKPKLLALDTFNLNELSRDWTSADEISRRKARDFCAFFENEGFILFVTLHHLLEMIAHENDATVDRRIQFLGDQALIAWATPANDGEGFGSIVDVVATEAKAATMRPGTDAGAIREGVSKRIVKVGSGRDALSKYADGWQVLRKLAIADVTHSREIVAVSAARLGDNYDKPVWQVLSGNLRNQAERMAAFGKLRDDLQSQIAVRGDKKIQNPEDVAAKFFDKAAVAGEKDYYSVAHMFFDTLIENGVDPYEVPPEMKFRDVLELIDFRQKIIISADIADIDLDDVKKIGESQIPSWIVYKNFRANMQD